MGGMGTRLKYKLDNFDLEIWIICNTQQQYAPKMGSSSLVLLLKIKENDTKTQVFLVLFL